MAVLSVALGRVYESIDVRLPVECSAVSLLSVYRLTSPSLHIALYRGTLVCCYCDVETMCWLPNNAKWQVKG